MCILLREVENWTWTALVGFICAVIGQFWGYRDGLVDGQAKERTARRLDELTGTRRL